MYQNLGYFLLLLSGVCSAYGVCAALLSVHWNSRPLFLSACRSASFSSGACVSAAALLWIMLFSRDYSVSYIFRNSSNDLPWLYTFGSFWSALEGSHFLWTLFLSLCSLVAHKTYAQENEPLMPYVSAVLQGVLGWMFYLALTHSDPFAPQFPIPQDGMGMNALLQNPYMTFHPPSLFIGYTTLAIPFAYAIGALCYGDIPAGWVRTVRRWSLVSFLFLTVGVFLGGRWAYMELGWAGYWAWDPVENSSFMPWLFNTALLHSLVVQEKVGHLKRVSLILACLSFFFSYFGTFITRSGMISSVHSFAQSPIGPNYLYFLGSIFGMTLLLYAWRAPGILAANTQKIWGLSKESALVASLFLLGTFAVIIFVGTMYPIVSEALTGSRFNVQAPYFNAFAPYIGFAMAIGIALGNLMRFEGERLTGGWRLQGAALGGSLLVTVAFAHQGGVFASEGWRLWVQLWGIYLCFWSIHCLVYDLWVRLKHMQFQVLKFLHSQLSYTGAWLAHIGVMIAILGFLGNLRGMEKTVTLHTGQTTELFGYVLGFEGLQVSQEGNATLFTAPLRIEKDGHYIDTLRPSRASYPTSKELYHEVGLSSHVWHDLYGVLAEFHPERPHEVTLQLHVNPTVKWVWMSAVWMFLGGLLAWCDRLRGRLSRDHVFASLPESLGASSLPSPVPVLPPSKEHDHES